MSNKKSKVNQVYHQDIRGEENFVGTSQKTIQLSRNDKKPMTIKEIVDLVKTIEDIKASEGYSTQILVKGLGPDREHTLKGRNEPMKTIEEYLQYFQSDVKDSSKFDSFYNIQITVFSSKIGKDGTFIRREDAKHEKIAPMTGKKPKEFVEKVVTKAIFNKKSKK